MKYLLVVIALIVAVVLAALYVPVKDGKPLLEWDRVKETAANPSSIAKPADSTGSAQAPSMYRWRDSNGNWQYGDVPPAGVDAEPVEVKPTRRVSPEAIRQGRLEDGQNSQNR